MFNTAAARVEIKYYYFLERNNIKSSTALLYSIKLTVIQ
jgi:hypothetical protein